MPDCQPAARELDRNIRTAAAAQNPAHIGILIQRRISYSDSLSAVAFVRPLFRALNWPLAERERERELGEEKLFDK
jgi:hypothetical protein